MLSKFKLSTRILFIGFVITICFSVAFAWFYPKVKENMYEAKYLKTRHLVEAAFGVLEYYVQQTRSNGMSLETAQTKAKESIKAALGQLPGSRFGLVAFSGEAYKLCPLTTDVNAFKLFVDLIEPSLIPSEGTDIGGAIRKSMELFPEQISGSKIIILVSDGENTRGDPRVDALNARKEGIKVFTISAGTKEGAPIPKFDSTGKFQEYLKDENGKPHISIVNQDILKLVARAGDGSFLEGEGVELGILIRFFRGLRTGEFSSEKVEHYQEKFIFFLIPALLFLITTGFLKTEEK